MCQGNCKGPDGCKSFPYCCGMSKREYEETEKKLKANERNETRRKSERVSKVESQFIG